MCSPFHSPHSFDFLFFFFFPCVFVFLIFNLLARSGTGPSAKHVPVVTAHAPVFFLLLPFQLSGHEQAEAIPQEWQPFKQSPGQPWGNDRLLLPWQEAWFSDPSLCQLSTAMK